MTPSPVAISADRFVSAEDVARIIKNTIILCPTREYPTKPTEALIRQLIEMGASIQLTSGVSDVALARSMTAGLAYETCKKDPGIEHVFWLDDDMTGTPADIAALCDIADALNVSVCGYYCMRNDRERITTKILDGDISTLRLSDTEVVLYPAWSGLGCMAHPVQRFFEACDAAPWCTMSGTRFPAVFESGAKVGADGQHFWMSEDIHFSNHLWQHAHGLYLAPIEFGHLTVGAAHPLPTARFIDQKKPE